MAALPAHLKAQVERELDRLELILKQIKTVEGERDALLAAAKTAMPGTGGDVARHKAMLLDIRGIGPEFAAVLGRKGSSDTSTTDARSPLMRAWHRHRGRVEQLIGSGRVQSRQSAAANNIDPARLAVAAQSTAISAHHLVSRASPAESGAAYARQRSWRWRESCWSRSGNM
jgi:hypothetical protein